MAKRGLQFDVFGSWMSRCHDSVAKSPIFIEVVLCIEVHIFSVSNAVQLAESSLYASCKTQECNTIDILDIPISNSRPSIKILTQIPKIQNRPDVPKNNAPKNHKFKLLLASRAKSSGTVDSVPIGLIISKTGSYSDRFVTSGGKAFQHVFY